MSQPVAYEPSRETAAAPDRIGAVGVTLFAVLAALFIWRAEPYGRSLAMLGMMMLAVTVHLTGYALAASLFGLRPWTFSLFQGGALLRFQVRECWVAIGWLPLGGYVRFAGDEPESSTGWGGLQPPMGSFRGTERTHPFAEGASGASAGLRLDHGAQRLPARAR